MCRFYRGLIIGVFRLMCRDNVVASVEEVHKVACHLAQPSPALGIGVREMWLAGGRCQGGRAAAIQCSWSMMRSRSSSSSSSVAGTNKRPPYERPRRKIPSPFQTRVAARIFEAVPPGERRTRSPGPSTSSRFRIATLNRAGRSPPSRKRLPVPLLDAPSVVARTAEHSRLAWACAKSLSNKLAPTLQAGGNPVPNCGCS